MPPATHCATELCSAKFKIVWMIKVVPYQHLASVYSATLSTLRHYSDKSVLGVFYSFNDVHEEILEMLMGEVSHSVNGMAGGEASVC